MSPEGTAACIKKMRIAVKRMMSLIESTLGAAKMEAGKIQIVPKSIDPRALLADGCEQQEELTPSHGMASEERNATEKNAMTVAC